MIIFSDIDDAAMYNIQQNVIDYDIQINDNRHQLIKKLFSIQNCIPITGRTFQEYESLQLPFESYAVLNHGATIINRDKSVNIKWKAHIAKYSLQLQQEKIFEIISKNIPLIFLEMKVTYIKEEHIVCSMTYTNPHKNQIEIKLLKKSIQALLEKNHQENDVYFEETPTTLTIIPYFMNKIKAVQFLIEELGYNELMAGLGHSTEKMSFVRICDFSVIPNDQSFVKLLDM